MAIIEAFFGSFTWHNIITTGLRILMLLLLAWIAMKTLQKFLARMERDLIRKNRAGGEPLTESEKRIDILITLIKQGILPA